jgi:exonuclease III
VSPETRFEKLTIIQAYSPTNEAIDEAKDDFYNQPQETKARCKRHDMILVIGDLNAKVGNDKTSREDIMGKHGVGSMNDNGERLCE